MRDARTHVDAITIPFFSPTTVGLPYHFVHCHWLCQFDNDFGCGLRTVIDMNAWDTDCPIKRLTVRPKSTADDVYDGDSKTTKY